MDLSKTTSGILNVIEQFWLQQQATMISNGPPMQSLVFLNLQIRTTNYTVRVNL
jgi:hypothetical protein